MALECLVLFVWGLGFVVFLLVVICLELGVWGCLLWEVNIHCLQGNTCHTEFIEVILYVI